MFSLLRWLVILAICFVGIGLYRGWFSFSKSQNDPKSDKIDVRVSVDKGKVEADLGKVEKKLARSRADRRSHEHEMSSPGGSAWLLPGSGEQPGQAPSHPVQSRRVNAANNAGDLANVLAVKVARDRTKNNFPISPFPGGMPSRGEAAGRHVRVATNMPTGAARRDGMPPKCGSYFSFGPRSYCRSAVETGVRKIGVAGANLIIPIPA